MKGFIIFGILFFQTSIFAEEKAPAKKSAGAILFGEKCAVCHGDKA